MRTRPIVLVALLAAGVTAPAAAQTLAGRITGGADGTVRLSFAARPEVRGERSHYGPARHDAEWESDAAGGPLRVALDVAGHRVIALRFHQGGHWLPASRSTRDLGDVSAPEAAAYLLRLAATADGDVAHAAIAPAALADSAVVWPELLALAKDPGRPEGVRRDATFWLSQQAARAATTGLAELAQSDGDRQVRHTAVFALSQRPTDEGLPVLMRLAQTSRDPAVRRDAIFWLGQSHDPRALDFLREILTSR